MKKKLGDMTVGEIQQSHRFIQENNLTCKECPLYPWCGRPISSWSAEKEINLNPLTPSEMAICRALGAKWVSGPKNETGDLCYKKVWLWDDKPTRSTAGDSVSYISGERMAKLIAIVEPKLFPSVKPGDLIYVGEGEEDE